MMTTGSASFGFLALVAVISGCAKPEKEPEPLVPVHLVKVQRKTLTLKISVDAVLSPADQAMITPKISAPVAKYFVQRGQAVRKGQLLAQLENRDLSAAVAESSGTFKQAEAGFQTATQASIPEEMQKAQLDVSQAKESLDAQSKLLESRRALFQQGAMPRKDLDQAQVQYVQAKAQFDIAARHLQSLQSVSHEQAMRGAQGQLAQAKGHLAGAQAQLAYSEIRSPIDGVVTDRPAFAGETISSGTPLITVMNLANVIAKAHIPQDQAVSLKKGDVAQIEDAVTGRTLAGKVLLVSPALDPNSTTVEVWVTAKNDLTAPLRPGSAARVLIEAVTVKDTLAVPLDAVVPTDEGNAVMTVGSDNVAHVTKVKAGITDRDQKLVQILEGVNEKVQVISGEAYALPEGTKVKPAEDAAMDPKPEPGKSAGPGSKSSGDKEKD